MRGWALTAGLAVALMAPIPGSAQVALRLASPRFPADTLPVEAVWDVRAQQAGESPNPFRYDCIAKLEAVSAQGLMQFVGAVDLASVRVIVEGQPQQTLQPEVVARIANNERLLVLLPVMDAGDRYRVRLTGVEVRQSGGGPVQTLDEVETDAFVIPDQQRTLCGSKPDLSFDFQQPTDGQGSLALGLHAVQRGGLHEGNGLWELFLDGTAASADSEVLFDSWKAGGRVDVRLVESPHWVALGLVGGVEASEDLATIDRVLGVGLRVRLDFALVDRLVRPFISRFLPYPVLVVEYDNVERWASRGDGAGVGEAVSHRLSGGLEWSVPLLIDTRLRVRLHGDYLLSELPAGETDRFKSLTDLSLEYPITASGDVVAVLSRLNGETAPTFSTISRYLLGLGIRR